MTEKITKDNLKDFEASIKSKKTLAIVKPVSKKFLITIKKLISRIKDFIKLLLNKLKNLPVSKRKPMIVFASVFLTSLLVMSLIFMVLNSKLTQVKLNSLAEYFKAEEQAYFDPVVLKDLFDKEDKGNLILDIRLTDDYRQKHIKGAVNIPVYQNKYQQGNWQGNKTGILREIKKAAKGKRQIILYGYQVRSKTNLELSAFLNDHNLKTKILSISFFDWQNSFYHWLPGAQNGGLNMEAYLEPKENQTTMPIMPN